MSVYAFNQDPQTESGVLKGIKVKGDSYTANSAVTPDIYESDWIKYEVSGILS